MKQIYFNHSLLINAQRDLLNELLLEISACKQRLRKTNIPLFVYENFWEIPILADPQKPEPLSSFLGKISNRDLMIVSIYDLMNNGPHYQSPQFDRVPKITPKVTPASFGETILHICFQDLQDFVLSLSNEKILSSTGYQLNDDTVTHEVINLIGEAALIKKLEPTVSFTKIQDVFQKIKENHPEIVILDSAEKSAQKHNFKGGFNDVYKTVVALKSEMDAILAGIPDRRRMDAYLKNTGFEISGETPSLKNNKKYKKIREFTIGDEEILFEWHIKIGRETRIHFYISKEEKKIYIGHCGKHLPTPSFSS